jgi:uncharacterized delta-60 repeat protein
MKCFRSPTGWFLCLGLLLACGTLEQVNGQANLVADAFDPRVQGDVLAVAEQADGKVLIGGNLTRVGGITRRFIARVNSDGSLDGSFKPVLNGVVHALAVQADGRILVGGAFSRVNGIDRDYLARLNSDGSLDAGFAPTVGGDCRTLLIAPDEKIIAGGVGFLRRLQTSGANDATFNSPNVVSRRIYTLALQQDGKLLVGGNIEFPRRGLMRLMPDGTLDTSFIAELDRAVRVVKVLPDGRLMVGGEFLNANNLPTPFIARLQDTGFKDATFDPGLASEGIGATEDGGSGSVRGIEMLSDGGVLVMGDVSFTGLAGLSRPRIAKYADTGRLLDSLNLSATGVINQSLRRVDGRILIAGNFTELGGKPRVGAARLVSPTPVAAINFEETTFAVSEADGSVILKVELDVPIAVPFSVPLTFGGSATAGKDYIRPSSPLRFEANEMSKDLVITLLDDDLIEADETLTVTLGTPNDPAVSFGSPRTAIITITSDDVAPEITTQPVGQIVAVGQTVALVADASGTPSPRLQWLRNGRSVAGATGGTLTIPSVALTDAGNYTMRATVGVTSVVTVPAPLTVVDQNPSRVVAATTASVTLRAPVASREALSYRWHRNGAPLTDALPAVRGALTASLNLRGLTLADAAVYHCEVTSPAGTLNTGDVTLVVYDAPPEMQVVASPLVLPTAMVSEDYSFVQPINPDPLKTPTRFVIRGLPRGMTFDRVTGLIRGRPLVAGNYNLLITPSNSKGAGASLAAELQVIDLPVGTVGSYVALIGKDEVVNGSLGGVLSLKVAKTGVVTGSIRAGAEVRSFRTVLDTFAAGGDPTLVATVRRTGGRPSFQLELTLRPATNGVDGTVEVAGFANQAAILGHACLPANPALLGRHNVTIELADVDDEGVEAVPQGQGFLSFAVNPKGTIRVTGRTADGASVVSATHLGPAGEVQVFALQYRNTGSLHGQMTVAADATHTVNGDLKWEKFAQANVRERSYRAGFGAVELDALGGLYEAPTDATQPVMGLPLLADNARLIFAEGGVDTAVVSPNLTFTLTNRAAGQMPSFASGNNPNRVSINVNRNTGAFSGRFVLVNALPSGRNLTRSVSFQGVIAFDGGGLSGGGYFLLPKLPVTPEELPTRTNILSGIVLLDAP